MQAIKHRRPYWRYRHNDSVINPRPEHLALDGKIVHADDPFWQTHFPPNGWGCKCYVETLAPRDLEREGIDPDSLQAPEVIIDPKTGDPVGIDKGWGYAPGASVQAELARLIEQKAAKLPEQLAQGFAAAMATRQQRPATIRSGGLDVPTDGLPESLAVQGRPLAPDAIGGTYWVDVAALNAAWRADAASYYISHDPPQGTYDGGDQAPEIAGRRARFLEWLRGFGTRDAMEASMVSYTRYGVDFTDGRHRFSVLRDLGIDRVPVTVLADDEEKLQEFLARFGADAPAAGRLLIPPPGQGA
jgi:hypothetical protein